VGGSDHHLHLRSGEELWITTEPDAGRPFAAVYGSSGALQYVCPYAVRAYRYETDDEGDATALVARQIMPISPQTDMLTNGSFVSNLSGWTTSAPTGTATWSHDAATYYDAAGSAKVALGTGNDTGRIVSAPFETVPGQTYQIMLAVKSDTLSTDEISYVGIKPFVTDDGGAGTTSWLITGFGYILNTSDVGGNTDWNTRGYQFTATDDSYVFGIDVRNTMGVAVNVWLDQIAGGVAALYVSEVEMGKITVAVTYRDRWLS
jgi:hypothetical protein